MRKIRFRQAIYVDDKFHHWHYWGFLPDLSFTGPDLINGLAHALDNSCAFTGLCDCNGKEIYDGDIVKMQRSIRTGSQRRKVGRSYSTYAINSNLEFNGVVKIGEYEKFFCKYAHVAYIDTQFFSEYPSYFLGEGKKSDKPQLTRTKYTEALRSNREYEVIGNIYENPSLLEQANDNS